MSRKSQKRRTPQRRPTAARTEPRGGTAARETRPGRWSIRPAAVIVGATLALVVTVGIWALANGGGTARPGSPSSSPIAANPSASPVLASIGTGGPAPGSASPAPGGKVAEALVAALHATPFIAHIEESILASSLTGGKRLTLTASAAGDVAGGDVAIRTTSTGGGRATDQQIVSVGDVAWTRATGASSWIGHPRSDAASALDGLLTTIRLIDDAKQIADTGIETLDGVRVHHLVAAGPVAFRSLTGVDGTYDNFDVWVTDAGIPVLMKATFDEIDGVNSLTGSTQIRYSKVGGPITISPPAGAPTLTP